ncbi:MAG: tyrosine-type recombinase/integrase [Treponema sp.]|jgi:integrase|nr:tyrosine-type recombinase/integrase [Treponema sp.]
MAVQARTVQNKRDQSGVLTGKAGTVYDVNIKYNSPDGSKKTYAKKGFVTKNEALRHEAEMKTKLQNPNFAASIQVQSKRTVGAYLNEWVENYARVNLRPSTYDGYKRTIAIYINPYIGNVPLNQLAPSMVDNMFRQIIDKGLKPSTAAGAKRVLSVALGHARKYRYIETNAARDTLTKFGKGDKTPDPYTPEQVAALMRRVAGTEWEMPVILGGLYGMRRSEILGLRWQNVDIEKGTFSVVEQLPFKVPPKTTIIEQMAPPKSNGRALPITDIARPFFENQLYYQAERKQKALDNGKPHYDNGLVVSKPDGAPMYANWISSGFGKLLDELNMPHIRFHDLRHSAATNMHQLTGDFYTVGEILGHTLAGIGASLGLSMNFEAVTARYVDVRLERKKEVLDLYHAAVHSAVGQTEKRADKAEPKKRKGAEMDI